MREREIEREERVDREKVREREMRVSDPESEQRDI